MTQDDIIQAIIKIKTLVGEGYSITLARHLACGNAFCKLHRAVLKHEAYLPILNQYLAQKRRSIRYNRDGDYKLISTSGIKSANINYDRKGHREPNP